MVPCELSHEVNGPVGSGACFNRGLASTNVTESMDSYLVLLVAWDGERASADAIDSIDG